MKNEIECPVCGRWVPESHMGDDLLRDDRACWVCHYCNEEDCEVCENARDAETIKPYTPFENFGPDPADREEWEER